MRIIAGKFKGRKIETGSPSLGLRPTKSDAKGALFSILYSRYKDKMEGAEVLDLCAGSGAIGLEFISRWARSVDFVDLNHTKIILQNIKNFKLNSEVGIFNWDVTNLPNSIKKYDVIFFDPPYDLNVYETVQQQLLNKNYLHQDSLLIIESYTKIDYQVIDGFKVELVRNYGICKFTFVRPRKA